MPICSLLIPGIHTPREPFNLTADANKEGHIRSFLKYHFTFGSQSPSEPLEAHSKTPG